MKNDKKIFVLIEIILAVLVIITAVGMLWGQDEKDVDKVSVIIPNSDDNQWAAFKYGLRMAAEEQQIEVFIVSTGADLTVEEVKGAIESEIDNGADAVIIQPVPGIDAEKMLKEVARQIPVMLTGYRASKDTEASVLPTTEPDNYAMGAALAEEILKDYSGNIDGKTFGILSESTDSAAVRQRELGFREGIESEGVRISWASTASYAETEKNFLIAQTKVDVVIALDDYSLTKAGECSAANNLHGALLYGIAGSTEAVYYLDTGIAECLVLPDEFNVGYQSMTKVSQSLGNFFYKMQDITVSYAVIRRETLFSKENQKILFKMSQ